MSKFLGRFSEDGAGGMTLRATILFGIAAMALSIFAAPALQNYSKQYAENNGYGVDRVVTGSVRKPKRYTVRKSVLDKHPVRICSNGKIGSC